jgi:Protein of unknown function (DUF1153)
MMSAKEVALMTDVPDEVQRRTAKRKTAVVMSIVKGETLAAEAARNHGLTVAEIERWQEQFFAAGENALRARPKTRRRPRTSRSPSCSARSVSSS